MREKLDMLTLRCLCRVVGLGQLRSRHVVGNDRFRGHNCPRYFVTRSTAEIKMNVVMVSVTVTVHTCLDSNFSFYCIDYRLNLWVDSLLQSWTLTGTFQVPSPVCYF